MLALKRKSCAGKAPLGLGGRRQQGLEHGQAVQGAAQVGQHGDEFIATQARQRIARAQGALQAVPERDQQLVAGLVAELVVEGLEAVQVQIDHRHLVLVLRGLAHGDQQAVGQQAAVGQTGQGVVLAQALYLALLLAQRAQVGRDAGVALQAPAGVGHRADGEQAGIDLARFAPVPDFPAPQPVLAQRQPHLAVKRGVVAARGPKARVLAQQFLASVAGEAAQGGIDVDDLATGVGDDDGVVGVFVHAGGAAQGLRRQLALGHVLGGAEGLDHRPSLIAPVLDLFVNVADGAVAAAHDAVHDLVASVARLQGSVVGGFDGGAVFGVDELQKSRVGGGKNAWLEAKQAVELVTPHQAAALQIEGPAADVCHALEVGQALLAGAQLLGVAAGGDPQPDALEQWVQKIEQGRGVAARAVGQADQAH